MLLHGIATNSRWINPHSEFSPINTLATCCRYCYFPPYQPHSQEGPEPFLQLEVCRIHTLLLVLQWSEKKKKRSGSVSPSVVSDSFDLMNYTPPGSSVHGIFQARILEWIAIPFSRGSSWPRDWTWNSCIAVRFLTVWATRNFCCNYTLYYLDHKVQWIIFPLKKWRPDLSWEKRFYFWGNKRC